MSDGLAPAISSAVAAREALRAGRYGAALRSLCTASRLLGYFLGASGDTPQEAAHLLRFELAGLEEQLAGALDSVSGPPMLVVPPL